MVAESPGRAPTMIPRALPPKMRAIILKVKTVSKAAKISITLILSLTAGRESHRQNPQGPSGRGT